MKKGLRTHAIEKLAFYGPADVYGAPTYRTPPFTVGQAMYDINAFGSLDAQRRRQALDDIVKTRIDVNSPAKRLFNAGLGALAGKALSSLLGANPFNQGMATAIGANYGYNA